MKMQAAHSFSRATAVRLDGAMAGTSIGSARLASSLRVTHCAFSRVRRDRYFGRVEALLQITIQYHPSLPPRTETLLTNVALRSGEGKGMLRARLIEDAVNLAVLMHRADRGDHALAA